MNERHDLRTTERMMSEEAFMAQFREHYEREERERPFTDYEPAYRFSYHLYNEHPDKPWEEIEEGAEEEWLARHRVTSADVWEEIKGVVYEGWEALHTSFGENEQSGQRHYTPPSKRIK